MAYQYPIRKEVRRALLKRMIRQAIRNLERVLEDLDKFDSIIDRYYRDEPYDTDSIRIEVRKLMTTLKGFIGEV